MQIARFVSMGCDVAVGGARAEELERIERLFTERDRMFSRFRPDSELSRVNLRAGMPTVVSPAFGAMLELALTAASTTRDLVDPTLGAAVEAAGYDRDFSQLGHDVRPVGAPRPGRWRSIVLAGRLLQTPRDVMLDLNGVVKAKTVDDALAVLYGDGFVSAGGDVAANAALDVELPGAGGAVRVSGALATSGRDRRRWIRGGVQQHHLVDPATGTPSTSPWLRVTASGATCVAADFAAKAGFLLGRDGPYWLDERSIPARFEDAAGAVTVNESWIAALGAAACT